LFVVILNLYPYITGHLMIVPYLHTSEFDAAPKEITDEMMDLTKRSQTALREVYSPSGFNMGMNLGSAAGAGIATTCTFIYCRAGPAIRTS
jgi:ATP adenylyltransferase